MRRDASFALVFLGMLVSSGGFDVEGRISRRSFAIIQTTPNLLPTACKHDRIDGWGKALISHELVKEWESPFFGS